METIRRKSCSDVERPPGAMRNRHWVGGSG
jgi:hypothetical protein